MMSARIRIWALAACLIGLVFVSASGFAQREKCVVDPPELHWVVDRPGEDMAPVTVGVYRNPGAGSGAIRFRMTNLVSENGHVLPPDCIEIYSGYTDHWQSFASRSDHLVLLASGQTSNEISVRLSPSVWGPAGIYRGYLESANGGAAIQLTVEIPRRARLVVEPSKISITAGLGPGTYRTNEKISITVDANHPNWTVSQSTDGLKYVGDPKPGAAAAKLWIEPEQLYVRLEGDAKFVQNLTRPVMLQGEGYTGKTFTVWIECSLGWEHLAGNYEGAIDIILAQK
ncbi:MAG: hypothetical protein WAP20_09025 [Limnochordia bacterium]|jgi:hypothetical protein|nr:hypothetical protein [Bacillota bacterium]NLH30706.1 hypothetical protein [Bacillota bacterium]HOB09607.1 hypothetical protein [Limnochordia bacterium]HPZ31472.1 hypothetical protein [Limnochordia bacterium]HQD71304.1 hypothetical protein [Limnochordia bacterium]